MKHNENRKAIHITSTMSSSYKKSTLKGDYKINAWHLQYQYARNKTQKIHHGSLHKVETSLPLDRDKSSIKSRQVWISSANDFDLKIKVSLIYLHYMIWEKIKNTVTKPTIYPKRLAKKYYIY